MPDTTFDLDNRTPPAHYGDAPDPPNGGAGLRSSSQPAHPSPRQPRRGEVPLSPLWRTSVWQLFVVFSSPSSLPCCGPHDRAHRTRFLQQPPLRVELSTPLRSSLYLMSV